MAELERAKVMRGTHKDLGLLFGPIAGCRLGNVVAYEWELPRRFEPWPGRTRLERTFVLLDLGVSFSNPCWAHETKADGSVVEADPLGSDSWYVDLITVETQGDCYLFRDLYIDVIVPTDGRPYRLLDLDEFADAIEDGSLTPSVAIDGLRRWQRFLDQRLHMGRFPPAVWSDFPPSSIRRLWALDEPLMPGPADAAEPQC